MTPLSVSQVDELVRRYHGAVRIQRSKSLLRAPNEKRQRILRPHHLFRTWDDPVSDAEEITARDNVDSLLELVSILEVLAVATGETPLLPSKIQDGLVEFLND